MNRVEGEDEKSDGNADDLFMRAINCLDSSCRNYKRSGGYVMCVEFRGSCQKQGVKRYFVTWTGACEMRNLLNTL